MSVSRSLTLVMPVLNEAAGIEAALRALAPLRESGVQVVVADGGSADGTVARAQHVEGVEVDPGPARARRPDERGGTGGDG